MLKGYRRVLRPKRQSWKELEKDLYLNTSMRVRSIWCRRSMEAEECHKSE